MCIDGWTLDSTESDEYRVIDDEVRSNQRLPNLYHADDVVDYHLTAYYQSNQANRRMSEFTIRTQL